MTSHQIFKTISSLSYDNPTNVSTQHEDTNRMIREIKHLKEYTFKQNDKKENFFLTNFHINTLRDSIHKNEKYKQILNNKSSSIRPKLTLRKYPKTKTTQYENNTMTISSLDDKSDSDYNRYKTITEPTILPYTTKSRNYYFANYANVRNESLTNFNARSKEIRLKRIENHIRQDTLFKYENTQKNRIDQVDLDIYNYSTTLEYLKSFAQYSDAYMKFLHKTIDEESTKNQELRERKIFLLNDRQKINRRLHKMQVLCENNFQNKFFLLCVKNNTNQVKDFCDADRKEYEEEQEKIKNLLHITVVETDNVNNPHEGQKIFTTKRISQISESDLIIARGFKKPRPPYRIFDSAEEFKNNLNSISLMVANLLNIYNEKQQELRVLRNELEEKREEMKAKMKEMITVNEDEVRAQEAILKVLKKKNMELVKYKDSLPKTNKTSYMTLYTKIYQIYNNINSLYPLSQKKRFCYETVKTTPLDCLKALELATNFLVIEKENFKRNNPKQYNESKKEIDKEKKNTQTQLAILKEKERVKNKILKIIQKNKKLIFKPKLRVSTTYYIPKKKKYKMKTNRTGDNLKEIAQEMNDIFNEDI